MDKALPVNDRPHRVGYRSDAVVDVGRTSRVAAGLFLLYVALDWLTYVYPVRLGITPLNPQAAAAIVLLMFCGMRYVPVVFAAVLWGEYALPSPVRPLALVLLNSAVLTAGYATMAHLLAGRLRIRFELDTLRDMLRLMAVALAGMLLCGLAYVGVLGGFDIGREDSYFSGLSRFFIGYSVGILIAAPLLFMMLRAKRRRQLGAMLRSFEAWLQMLSITACLYWLFLQQQEEHVRYFYLLFLPLIWAATRFGVVGAASGLALIQTGLLVVFRFGGYQPLSVFELQLLLIALAITGLLLGVSIDEQRRAAADFRESLKLAAAGEMAAAITHEINQPLTAMSGYATAGQLIAAAPQPDLAQLNDTMRKLIEESRRTSEVVRRLRDFFRSGATRLEPVVLPDLITNVMAALRPRAEALGVEMRCRDVRDTTLLLMDAVQIEVVLRNLLMNAIESAEAAASTGGRVDVMIGENTAGEVVVEVHDSGAGIREADVERLFESFVTTKTSGMGMGLAISRAIVDAHGGRIWAVPGNSGLLCFALRSDGVLSNPANTNV
jgi:signal transduction histidine kinase